MLTLAVGALVVAYLLLYAGFTNTSPLRQVAQAFGRGGKR